MVNKLHLVFIITGLTVSHRKETSKWLKRCFIHVTIGQIVGTACRTVRALNSDLTSQETFPGSNNLKDMVRESSRGRRWLFQGTRWVLRWPGGSWEPCRAKGQSSAWWEQQAPSGQRPRGVSWAPSWRVLKAKSRSWTSPEGNGRPEMTLSRN